MRLSKYREYRPDLIMVGPQFQASIPDRPLFTQGIFADNNRSWRMGFKITIKFDEE